MAKRFIDTKIWDKQWFRKLTARKKLLWLYIITKCDHAGIWDADFEAASFFIGETVSKKDLDFMIDKVVCIKSKTGKIIFLVLALLAIAIPKGIPAITHRNIPIIIIAVVSIAFCQNIG